MAARDPSHPNETTHPVADRLRGVSIAGAGSTISDDELTTGNASKVKAILGATASPAGTNLLEAFSRWKASQAAAAPLAKAAEAAHDVEARAIRKSAKRLAKHLSEGMSPAMAVTHAHSHYRKHGGRSGQAVWARKISQGA
jgi:hypothetical protein